MGQKSGDTGVKASLRRRFERAFGRHPNYDECLEELEQSPSQAAIVVDGNVLLRQLPKNVSREATDNLPPRNEPATLHDYVEILSNRFFGFFRAADVVVLVFDQPETLTLAKEEEQRQRDGAAKAVVASSDFRTNTDDYSLRDMKLADPLHDLVKGRAARPRFSDQLVRMVKNEMARFLNAKEKTLVVDGADPRGALRPIGAVRIPRITAVGHEATALVQWFCQYTHTGEGDLKLGRIYDRLLDAHDAAAGAPEALTKIKTCFSFTIDTDEFPVQLLSVARRDVEGVLDPPVRYLIGLYEPSTKKTADVDGGAPSYSFCDVALLYRMLLADVFGERWKSLLRRTSAEHRREVITLITAGWAMLGCDFVSTVKKLTFDRVLEVAAAFTGGNRLVNLQKLWTGTRHDVRLLVPPVLKRFLELEERTRGTLASRAGDLDAARHTSTLQCAWLMSYWSGGPEITDDLDDFEIAVHPVSIADRRAQQLRRAVIRNHIVFFTIRLLALAKRARKNLAEQTPVRRSPRRNAEAAAPCARPAKRRRVRVPTGMGRAV